MIEGSRKEYALHKDQLQKLIDFVANNEDDMLHNLYKHNDLKLFYEEKARLVDERFKEIEQSGDFAPEAIAKAKKEISQVVARNVQNLDETFVAYSNIYLQMQTHKETAKKIIAEIERNEIVGTPLLNAGVTSMLCSLVNKQAIKGVQDARKAIDKVVGKSSDMALENATDTDKLITSTVVTIKTYQEATAKSQKALTLIMDYDNKQLAAIQNNLKQLAPIIETVQGNVEEYSARKKLNANENIFTKLETRQEGVIDGNKEQFSDFTKKKLF